MRPPARTHARTHAGTQRTAWHASSVARSSSGRRSHSASALPANANRSAILEPIPPPAPVTSTTLPTGPERETVVQSQAVRHTSTHAQITSVVLEHSCAYWCCSRQLPMHCCEPLHRGPTLRCNGTLTCVHI